MQKVILPFLALVGLSLAAPAPPKHDSSELIFGGHQAYQGTFPFYSKIPSCGASLITEKHILTAAHCGPLVGAYVVMGLADYNDYEIRDGVTSAAKPGVQVRKAVSVEVHTEYEGYPTFLNDIAILEVDEAFNFTAYVQPIAIKTNDSELQEQYWTTI
uniref:Peptidase S1 domain-containing protein n=1 Tax=Steinernema glaseri TaxID=37863 RepID=A0A1I7XW68_9BILA